MQQHSSTAVLVAVHVRTRRECSTQPGYDTQIRDITQQPFLHKIAALFLVRSIQRSHAPPSPDYAYTHIPHEKWIPRGGRRIKRHSNFAKPTRVILVASTGLPDQKHAIFLLPEPKPLLSSRCRKYIFGRMNSGFCRLGVALRSLFR